VDLVLDDNVKALRKEIRKFLADNLPHEYARKTLAGEKLSKAEHIHWHSLLRDKGWHVPLWPREYGGPGWGPMERFIWEEESGLAGAPRLNHVSQDLLGPVLIEFGTPEQKAELLPRILSSEDWWCQGFSEPQAGSDLANLQMRAVRDGDDYIVTGTKLWTSFAHLANKIFCLVRTSTDGPKQAGISFLLIDMEQPGVTVSPIYTLGGVLSVNEVQIEDVRVPVTNLVGREGGAWDITKFLLGNERLMGAWIGVNMALARQVRVRLEQNGPDGRPRSTDAALAQRVAEVETDLLALRYTTYRVLADELSGKAPGPEVSVIKVRGGEIMQALTELLMEMAEAEGIVLPRSMPHDGPPVVSFELEHMAQQFFDKRKLTIYGGSSEIQRNIIARRLLNV
jgi:alkylation response protein AidB-like acyl-CoA dehydrogenase